MVRQQGAEQAAPDPLPPPSRVDGQVRHVDLVGDHPEAEVADDRRRRSCRAGTLPARDPQRGDPVPLELVQERLPGPRRLEGHALDLEDRVEISVRMGSILTSGTLPSLPGELRFRGPHVKGHEVRRVVASPRSRAQAPSHRP